jgi:hypothetical protein
MTITFPLNSISFILNLNFELIGYLSNSREWSLFMNWSDHINAEKGIDL